MKIRNFILAFLLFNSNFFVSAQSLILNKKLPLDRKLEVDKMIFNINVHNNAESMALAKMKNINVIDLLQICEQKLAEGKKQITSLKDYILQNKLKITFYGLTTGYSYTLYLLNKLKNLINSTNSWAFWKSDLSMEKFLAIPQKSLTFDLIAEIQKKYCTKSNPDDAITPLILFVSEIDENIKYLNQFIKIVKIINFIKLTRFFLLNDKSLSEAQEKLNRLVYLKNLFSGFTSEFKQQKLLANIDPKNNNLAPAA